MKESDEGRSSFCCCCDWFRLELSRPMFGIDEKNGKQLNLDRSFCTGEYRSYPIILIKLILCGFSVVTFIYGWISYPYPSFYMAYLSYWTLAYKALYTLFSFCVTLFSIRSTSLIVKITWVLYTMASVHGTMVVILYWLTEFKSSYTITYLLIMAHGGVFCIILIDGILVNRVPVRLKHYIFPMIFAILFISWSIAQAFIPVDNPTKDGDDGDESLYNILNWVDSPLSSSIVSILVIFVSFPILTLVYCLISMLGRPYIRTDADRAANDEEQPSGGRGYANPF